MDKASILWVDLEMTGLDPDNDLILEVAAIATDWEFREIATYESAVRVDPAIMKERMDIGRDFWDANPAARDGLIKQNETAKESQTVESELAEFIENNFETSKPVLLGGNSIHQDRRFIINQWPRVDKLLHYRMLDVSAWKVVFEGKYKKKFSKPEEHRALEDIRGSIMELKYYMKKIKV